MKNLLVLEINWVRTFLYSILAVLVASSKFSGMTFMLMSEMCCNTLQRSSSIPFPLQSSPTYPHDTTCRDALQKQKLNYTVSLPTLKGPTWLNPVCTAIYCALQYISGRVGEKQSQNTLETAAWPPDLSYLSAALLTLQVTLHTAFLSPCHYHWNTVEKILISILIFRSSRAPMIYQIFKHLQNRCLQPVYYITEQRFASWCHHQDFFWTRPVPEIMFC